MFDNWSPCCVCGFGEQLQKDSKESFCSFAAAAGVQVTDYINGEAGSWIG